MTIATMMRRPPAASANPNVTYKMPDLGRPWTDPIAYLPNMVGVSVSVIYPDMALAMLATNSSRQRRRRNSTVAKYASDMAEGRWELTHQGIAFNLAGELFDGQHRLEACILAKVPFTTMVFFGVGDQKEMVVLDTGAGRTAVDASHVKGLDSNRNRVSYLRRFLFGGHEKKQLTHSFVLEQLDKYAPMLDFLESIPSHRLLPAGVRAALGRAFYYTDPEDLRRFVAILTDQEQASRPGDKTVVAFRTSQISRSARQSFREGAEWFMRSQRAIQAYLDRIDLTRIFAVEEDVYPLPTEHQIAVAHSR